MASGTSGVGIDTGPRESIDYSQVAIKIIDKLKVDNNESRTKQLVSEIKVHWILEKCDGAIKLIELFEDENFVYIVLEYQK